MGLDWARLRLLVLAAVLVLRVCADDASRDAMLGGCGCGEMVRPDESVFDPLRCASVSGGGRSGSTSVSFGSGDGEPDTRRGGVSDGVGGVDMAEVDAAAVFRGEWLCEYPRCAG